jgi:thioredoxin 1
MKSKLLIAVGIIGIMILSAAQLPSKKGDDVKKGISFENPSWNEVLALAKKENKPIFIDISTEWCYYCKRMKASVFTNSEVGEYYNKNFINVTFDAEKGEGIELKKKYGVTGYPTFVYLDSKGNLLIKTAGYRNSEKFIKTGQDALSK